MKRFNLNRSKFVWISTVEKFYFTMEDSNGNPHFKENGMVKMSALGRPFQIGTLYDYRTDSIISGRSFKLDFWTLLKPVKESIYMHPHFQDISPPLGISFLIDENYHFYSFSIPYSFVF